MLGYREGEGDDPGALASCVRSEGPNICLLIYLCVCMCWSALVCVPIADPAKLGFYVGAGDLSSGLLAFSW